MIDFELEKAIDLFVREKTLLGLQQSEHLLVLSDSENDSRVVEAIACKAYSAGARVIVMSYPQLPRAPSTELYRHVKGALEKSDVILELGEKRIYSASQAAKHGARYLAPLGLDRDKAVRLLTGYNYTAMIALGDALVRLTQAATEMRVTSKAGTDIRCRLDSERPVVKTEEAKIFPGLIGWAPIEESINGRAVFDGFTLLKADIIRTPLEVQIVDGRIQKDAISGIESERLSHFLRKWDDEKMYQVAHLTYGIIPTAQRSIDRINLGREDEHVFGTCTVGIGWQNPIFKAKSGFAAAHADGVILNASTWLGDTQIEMDGKFIHPDLIPIVERLFD